MISTLFSKIEHASVSAPHPHLLLVVAAMHCMSLLLTHVKVRRQSHVPHNPSSRERNICCTRVVYAHSCIFHISNAIAKRKSFNGMSLSDIGERHFSNSRPPSGTPGPGSLRSGMMK